MIMRNIVNGNEGLNVMLNEIVDVELEKTLDQMINDVDGFFNNEKVDIEDIKKFISQYKNKN